MKLQMSASQFAERIGKIDTIEHTASKKVGEAPADGNEYVRKDGTWTKPDKYSKAEADETFLKKTETPTLDNVYTKAEVDEKFEAKGTSYTKEETYTKTEVNERIPTVVDAYSKTESDGRYPKKAEVFSCIPDSLLAAIDDVDSQTGIMSESAYNTILSLLGDKTRVLYYGSFTEPSMAATTCMIENGNADLNVVFQGIENISSYIAQHTINKETRLVTVYTDTCYMYNAGKGGIEVVGMSSDYGRETTVISLLSGGTGSKFLSDDGSYKEIDTSSLAAKSEVSQYLNMPDELLSAIFGTTGDTATDENYAMLVKYVPAGENKVFLGNMISLGLSGSGKFAITNNNEEITIIIDYQDSSSNQSTKSLIGINHSTKAVTFSRIINSISVKDSGLTIYGNKRKADGTSLSKTIDLITNGTGSKYLSDDGSYKAIDINNLFFQPVSVTTLTNLPVDKYSIAATVSVASTISFASTPQNGMEYVIDIKNTSSSDITQPIPTDSDWQCDVDSVTLAAGKVTSISIRYVHSIYCVRV